MCEIKDRGLYRAVVAIRDAGTQRGTTLPASIHNGNYEYNDRPNLLYLLQLRANANLNTESKGLGCG